MTTLAAPNSALGASRPAPTAAPIRCLLVDDHPAIRLGLRELLEEDPGFTVLDSLSTAESGLAFAERTTRWEQDTVVNRRMAFDHYFGANAAAKKL